MNKHLGFPARVNIYTEKGASYDKNLMDNDEYHFFLNTSCSGGSSSFSY